MGPGSGSVFSGDKEITTGETSPNLLFCLQKPPSVDPRPSLVCSTLRLSDNGIAWSEVWADIPESDPQVLVLLAGSQVCAPVPIHAQGYVL